VLPKIFNKESTMNMRSTSVIACLFLSMLWLPLASRARDSGVGTDTVSAEAQQEISQVLWGCYAVGADLVGLGDVQGAKDVLRKCFADDMQFEALMPPAYVNLGFKTFNGAEGFVNAANQIYRSLRIIRTQHLITNIRVEKTGLDSAVVYSGALATHVYPDEHVFNATVKFQDEFKRVGGVWKIARKTMTVISVTQAGAWVP
jgi:hypothetical protein